MRKCAASSARRVCALGHLWPNARPRQRANRRALLIGGAVAPFLRIADVLAIGDRRLPLRPRAISSHSTAPGERRERPWRLLARTYQPAHCHEDVA